MNQKYRHLYLIIAFAALVFLVYDIVIALPNIDPVRTLVVALTDFLFFFLAYRTYPLPVEGTENINAAQHI